MDCSRPARRYSDFVVSHGQACRLRYPPDELSISDVARIGVLGRFRDFERQHRIEHDQVWLVQSQTGDHRDGNLLRGGIGLTTGLGWSDSEDEDAPSPLTRQLSAVDLRKKAGREAREREKEAEKEGLSQASSVASMVAVRPSPLGREMDEGAGARESVMSVGNIGSAGSMGSMGSVRSAPSRTTSSMQLKKTSSTRSLWSLPDEDGPHDQSMDGLPTPATTPILSRVLPGLKCSESGASSIHSVMAQLRHRGLVRTASRRRAAVRGV
jgi:hypothetical protein